MAHPDFGFVGQAGEQVGVRGDRDLCPAIFAGRGAGDFAPQLLAGQLHAVANAQHRNAEVENARDRTSGAASFVDAGRAAGEDDAPRGQLGDPLGGDRVADDLAVDVASRTRRAMSCAYCEPKSRIRTFSSATRGPRRGAGALWWSSRC